MVEKLDVRIDAQIAKIMDSYIPAAMRAFCGVGNICGLLAKLISPTALKYFKDPTEEGWRNLDPSIREVSSDTWQPTFKFIQTD